MRLAEELEIKSIFYSSISIKDSKEHLKWSKWKKTEYFSNSKTTSYLIDKVDIREKNIDTKIDFNLLYELDFSLTKEQVNLFTYGEISMIFSYHHGGKVQNSKPFFLDEPKIQAYNILIGENLSKVENVVLKDTDRAGQNAVWWYPVMFIPVDELNKNHQDWIRENMDFLQDENIFDPVTYLESIGYVGWDFAIFFYDRQKTQILETIDFYMKLSAMEYHCLTETSGRIIDLITDVNTSSKKKIDLCYSIYKDFFYSLSLLDKSILSYSNGDRDLLTSLANKWETVAFTERVIEKVDKMNQLYLYEADKIEKEDAEYLNRIVFLIAILGITGTVAGVISTIDASNDTFNTSLRVSIIVWSTILSGILFGYFLPFLFKLFSKKTKALKK